MVQQSSGAAYRRRFRRWRKRRCRAASSPSGTGKSEYKGGVWNGELLEAASLRQLRLRMPGHAQRVKPNVAQYNKAAASAPANAPRTEAKAKVRRLLEGSGEGRKRCEVNSVKPWKFRFRFSVKSKPAGSKAAHVLPAAAAQALRKLNKAPHPPSREGRMF